MNRAMFLVDGFNVHHSAIEAKKDANAVVTPWLDLRSLCKGLLPAARNRAGERASLAGIRHFSAPPDHLSRQKRMAYKSYVTYLRETGIDLELGCFKNKEVFCQNCRSVAQKHEEKKTDVAIASRLFEICIEDAADTIILVTGDTDLAPAATRCRRLFSAKLVFFAFPYGRFNKELKEVAPESIEIRREDYRRHQRWPLEMRRPA